MDPKFPVRMFTFQPPQLHRNSQASQGDDAIYSEPDAGSGFSVEESQAELHTAFRHVDPSMEDGYSVPVSRNTRNSAIGNQSSSVPGPTSPSSSYPVLAWNNKLARKWEEPTSRKASNVCQPTANDHVPATSSPVLRNLRVQSQTGETSFVTPDAQKQRIVKRVRPQSPLMQHFKPAGRLSKVLPEQESDRTCLWKDVSTLYGILITMSSACLMMSSHLTHNLDTTYSRWFNCAMMGIGICFLLFFLFFLFRKSKSSTDNEISQISPSASVNRTVTALDDPYAKHPEHPLRSFFTRRRFTQPINTGSDHVFYRGDTDGGSFYLKMGALVFAIGSIIYTCLEMGVYIENQSCFNIVIGIEPCFFVVFIMLQLYFIFRSSQLHVLKYQRVCWFGTIHLVATDICIWIRILIDETLHEFTVIKAKERNNTGEITGSKQNEIHLLSSMEQDAESLQQSVSYAPLCVNEESIMKDMLEKSSTFLYPCIVEYTLIAAGILFTMWSTVGSTPASSERTTAVPRTRYSVDCDQASKGMFAGVVVGVLIIVGIILFFVFIDRDKDKHGLDDRLGVLMGEIMEIILNSMGLLTTTYCMWQFVVHFQCSSAEDKSAEKQLADALLIVCMVGVYAYTVGSLLGTYAASSTTKSLSLVADIVRLLATSMQTVFITDAGKRTVRKVSSRKRAVKPGREALTFLLFLNFALWATNVFCALRVDASPVQRDFFGAEGWAVILHITVPLVIFYRFHSTACLVDIWKRAYKGPKQELPKSRG